MKMEEKPKNESFKQKLQSKRTFKSKMEPFKEMLSTFEQEKVKGSAMRKQWRSKSKGEDVGTVTGKGRAQWRRRKVK